MKKIFFLVFVLGFLNVKSQCDTTLTISVTPTQSGGTATWAAVSGAVTYSWAVIPGSGSNVSIISGATTSTIVSFSGLNASTAYRFQVVTVCSGSTSQPKRSPFSTTTARVVYTPMTAAGYQFKYLKVDSLLHVSAGDTTIARGDTRPGAIVYKNSDSLFYGWNGFKWNNLGSSTTSLINQINNKVDTIFYNTDTVFYRKNSLTYGIVLNLVPNIRAIVAGYGLAGGGDLSADRSFIVDSTVIASKPYVDAGLATKQNTLTNPITGTGVSGRVPFYTGTNTLSNDTSLTFNNVSKKFNINKAYIGGADTLFENDPYATSTNSLKIGGVAHQYGISVNQTNGGMDWTFFKESGDASGNRTPIIADRRVLPGQEIAYHQYSAHNGVDDIYSPRSVAVVAAAYPSYNSRLGDLHGWYKIITARDSGFKTTPPSIDFVLSEGKAAFNAPTNLRNSDLVRTMTVYGSARASDTLLSSVLNIGTNLNLYKNGLDLCYRNTGSSFDVLKFRESTRPVAVQGGPTHLPFYIYTDAGGGGFTNSLSVSTGLYLNNSGGFFNINNNEIFRYDFGAGGRVGVNTGSGNNATFDVRGSTSSTRAFLVKDNNSVELLRVNNGGNVIINPTTSSTLIGSTIDVGLGKLQVTGNCYVSGTLIIGTITISTGTGSPEGVVSANVGSQFMRTDGGANTTLYVKESGTGNTGWIAK